MPSQTMIRLLIAGLILCSAPGLSFGQGPKAWKNHNEGGWTNLKKGDLKQARKLLTEARQEAEKLFEADDPRLGLTLVYLGWTVSKDKEGDAKEAQGMVDQAAAIFKKGEENNALAGEGLEYLPIGLNALALYQEERKDRAAAEKLFLRAVAAAGRLPKGKKHTIAQLQGNLGRMYTGQGRFAEAEKVLLQALEAVKGVPSKEEIAVSISVSDNLGRLYRDQAKYDKAEEHLARALQARRKSFPDDRSGLARDLYALGMVLVAQENYSGAETVLREALAIRENIVSAKHRDTAQVQHGLATCLYHTKKEKELAEAEKLFNEALATRKEKLGDQDIHVARTLHSRGNLFLLMRYHASAKKDLDEALAITTKALGAGNAEVAAIHESLADWSCKKDKPDYKQAEEHFQKALAIREKALGKQHLSIAALKHNLANYYRDQSNRAPKKSKEAEDYSKKADDSYKEALAIKEKALSDKSPRLLGILRDYAAFLYATNKAAAGGQLMSRVNEIEKAGKKAP